MLDFFMPRIYPELKINSEHGFWRQQAFYQPYSAPTDNSQVQRGVLTYHGKNQKAHSAPGHVIVFEKSDRPLGKGSFGVVYGADSYALDYKSHTLTFKNIAKVVKILQVGENVTVEDIESEYRLGKKAPHLGMKKPVFTIDGKCHIVMKRLPGEELEKLIKDKKIENLEVSQKIILTYRLLQALKAQVPDIGMVHRDIKPKNILVALESEITVNIIDYGLAKPANVDDDKACGTPAYSAPEMFDGFYHDKPHDVFSMARVIALLWIEDKQSYNISIPKVAQAYAQTAANELENIQSADLKNHPVIFQILKDMLNANQFERPTIEQCIQRLERDYSEILGISLQTTSASTDLAAPKSQISSEKSDKFNTRMQEKLQKLQNYTENANLNKKDVLVMEKFIKAMQELTQAQTSSIPEKQQHYQNILNLESVKHCAQNHKYINYMLKNIAALVLTLGVGYIGFSIGARLAGGRGTFFHNPIHEQLDEFAEMTKSMKPSGSR